MAFAESTHEVGREGAYRAKRWLESTTRVDVPWIVYEHGAPLRVKRPNGTSQQFDLGGVFRGGDLHGREFMAEVKKYASAGAQKQMYEEYLADCYCATLDRGVDRKTEFMWITWHPFGTLENWSKLCTAEAVKSAITAKEAYLDGTPIDDGLCGIVADRLWMIVLSERQEASLVPTPEMVGLVRGVEMQRQLAGPAH